MNLNSMIELESICDKCEVMIATQEPENVNQNNNMKKLKYIINDRNIPVLFSEEIVHNEVLQKAKSAGFLMIKFDSLKNRFVAKCFGESTSLNIMANVIEDKKIIENFLNGVNLETN